MAARARNVLTDRQIRAEKRAPVNLRDGGGLYLEIKANGRRFWRHQFRVNGRERLVSLGEYPMVSLARARALASEHRTAAANGIDLLEQRRARAAQTRQEALQAREEAADTFGAWAEKFRRARAPGWSDVHARDVERILRELCDGHVDAQGRRVSRGFRATSIRALGKEHLLEVVDGAIARGARTYADDLITYAQAVVRFFNGRQARGRKVSLDELDVEGIRESIGPTPAARSHPKLPLHEVPTFVARLRTESSATIRVRRATQLLLLTGVRTVELRTMSRLQLDLAGAIWTVPPERMKHRRKVWAEFHVPLPRQAAAIISKMLAEIDALDADDPRRLSPLLFQNERDPFRPMSENTILSHLRRLGYGGRQSGHGFRGLISTWGNREGFHPDAIERQLSHVERDKVRGAYNSWEFWPERVKLMQAWADQLDAWFLQAVQAAD